MWKCQRVHLQVPLAAAIALGFPYQGSNGTTSLDIQQAFLQVGLKPEDRDAFRFVFELIDGTEQQYRFTRIQFGAEARPFLLGATLQHHYNTQP